MTKAEKAMLEDSETRAAFHRTPEVMPDLMPPEMGGQRAMGWAVVGRSTVEAVWTDSGSHGFRGCYASKGSISIYSTRMLALRGLRHEVELESARRLRAIDLMIAKETT